MPTSKRLYTDDTNPAWASQRLVLKTVEWALDGKNGNTLTTASKHLIRALVNSGTRFASICRRANRDVDLVQKIISGEQVTLRTIVALEISIRR